MSVAELSGDVLRLAREVMDIGLKSARSDVTVATFLAQAAIKGALLNVRDNLGSIRDEQFVAEYQARADRLEAQL